MSIVPQWILGRNVTAFQVYPCTVASDGTVTPGSAIAMAGLCEEIALEATNETENIVPMDVRQDNEVIIGSQVTLSLREIMSPTIVFAGLAVANDYVKVNFTRASKTWAGIFVVKSYGETIVRGKSTDTLNLGPAGIAVTYT